MLKIDSMGPRRIMIYGGTGSLGKSLIKRLAPDHEVAVYSRDEAKHWTIRNQFADKPWISNVSFLVGDIRDQNRIFESLLSFDPHIVIIAAALKQVDTCECAPSESILTNLTGTQNVLNAIRQLSLRSENHLSKVLFVSTDKACAPVNVYGMCKAVSERLVTSTQPNLIKGVKFLATRYGNVLESRGSIIPLFRYQAENYEHLTVTDPDMTRFLMTLDDSVDLIIHTLSKGFSGETWVPRLPSMRIGDLADIFAERSGKPIKIIGLRPGEKKHEDLVCESESLRTKQTNEHFIIGPAYLNVTKTAERFTYSSDQNVLQKDELLEHLTKLNVIDRPLSEFEGRNIEEIIA